MKKLILFLFAFTLLVFTGCMVGTYSTGSTQSGVQDENPDPTFSDLNSYGDWVNVPGLGSAWKPYDETNWQPYSNGQWVYTADGWMWDSNEPYGWIVYHYGYWNYDDYYGWVWVPSYDWQPARVAWFREGGYIGWAPIPPPTVSQAVIYSNANMTRAWVVVREDNFVSGNVNNYRTRTYVPDRQVIRSNNGGRAPAVGDIEQVSHQKIEPVTPVREQVKAGNRQLVRVRTQNDKPFSPSTVRDRSNTPNNAPVNTTNPVRNPASNVPLNNNQKPPVRDENQAPNRESRPNQINPPVKENPGSVQQQRTDQNFTPKPNVKGNDHSVNKNNVRNNVQNKKGNVKQRNTTRGKKNTPPPPKGNPEKVKTDDKKKENH